MMFISVRLSKKRVGIALACVACAVLLTLSIIVSRPKEAGGIFAATQAEREDLAMRYGWKISQPYRVSEALLPSTQDGAFSAYCALEQRYGFDTAEFAGKKVVIYDCLVNNYTDGGTAVFSVIQCGPQVVAMHMSLPLSGEIAGPDGICA